MLYILEVMIMLISILGVVFVCNRIIEYTQSNMINRFIALLLFFVMCGSSHIPFLFAGAWSLAKYQTTYQERRKASKL